MTYALRLLPAAYLLTIAGCQQPPSEAALPVTETFRDFGEYVVHFNAVTSSQLSPEIALRHGIIRSASRAMLTVSIIEKEAGAVGTPVAATVTASAVNLNGQLKNVTIREISEDGSFYYIGDCGVADEETLIFTIEVTPTGETTPFSIRYRKQFFRD